VLVVTVVLHSNLGQVFGNVLAVPAWYGNPREESF
jgi:hypothetical protein